MTNNKKENIDAAALLAMYRKVDKLKPKAFEYVNGLIDGISVAIDIAVNQKNQKGA
ncbi:MAG: hypothetical protein NC485_14510 [Ruminococcus flavefaciens]|nr:hypothetical protein [Ruminococcus flavefaciens]